MTNYKYDKFYLKKFQDISYYALCSLSPTDHNGRICSVINQIKFCIEPPANIDKVTKDNADQYADITKIYQILSDQHTKKEYDKLLKYAKPDNRHWTEIWNIVNREYLPQVNVLIIIWQLNKFNVTHIHLEHR